MLSSFSNPLERQQTVVDEGATEKCKEIHYQHPWAIQCWRILESGIFKNGIEMLRGEERVEMSEEFRNIFESYWIPFAKEALVEIFSRGIVPITIKRIGDIDPVPKVVKGRGVVTQYYDQVKDEMEFSYFRLNVSQGRALLSNFTINSSDKADQKVLVMSGFGYDPHENGVIRSPLSSLLKDSYFMAKIDEYALKTELKKVDPFFVTEVQDKASEGYGLDGIASLYSERDVLLSRHQNKLYANAAELESAFKQNEIYQDHYDKDSPAIRSSYMGFSKFETKNSPPRPFPLPAGHKLARPDYPAPRSDWHEMKEYFEKNICAAYGIPRSFLSGEGRVLAGIRANEQSFYENLRFWRKTVSDIFTRVYHIIYEKETVDEAVSELEPVQRQTITKKALRQKILSKRIRFVFPMETHDNFQELVQKYAFKVLPWKEFETLSRRSAGIPVEEKTLLTEDPWSEEVKLALITRQKQGATSKQEKDADGLGRSTAGTGAPRKRLREET